MISQGGLLFWATLYSDRGCQFIWYPVRQSTLQEQVAKDIWPTFIQVTRVNSRNGFAVNYSTSINVVMV